MAPHRSTPMALPFLILLLLHIIATTDAQHGGEASPNSIGGINGATIVQPQPQPYSSNLQQQQPPQQQYGGYSGAQQQQYGGGYSATSYTGGQPAQAGSSYGPAPSQQQQYQQYQQQQPQQSQYGAIQQPQQYSQQQQQPQYAPVTYAPPLQTVTPLVLPDTHPTLPSLFPSMLPTPPPMPLYDPVAAARAAQEPYEYGFNFDSASPHLYCSYGVNPIPWYNTPKKKCIPYHPLCGITFTCIFDVDPRTGYVVGQAKGVKK